MIAISCDGVSLSFGAHTVLNSVSFSLNEGERLGIVGANGAGKSSLFKIITGEYESGGAVYTAKGRTIGSLSQNAVSDSDKTLYDELACAFSHLASTEEEISRCYKRLVQYERDGQTPPQQLIAEYGALNDYFGKNGGYEYKNRVTSYLKKLGFEECDHHRRVNTLSGGQKTRIALGRLLLSAPDILLLDEPTNHLDLQTLFWLEDVIASCRSTVLVISHDRYFLDRTATKILDIENGRGKMYNGNYTDYIRQKERDREIQSRHYINRQREIARLEAFIEQQRRWNRERNIIAAESRQKAIDRMKPVEAPSALPDKIRMSFDSGSESGNDVLTVKQLSKSFDERTLFSDVSFLIKRGERVFITGKNGCGKSTLMKMLRGRAAPSGGTFEFGYNVRIGYYDQENQELDEENTVLSELWSEFERSTQTQIRSALALFLFRGDDIEKKVSVLSGGEKARLTLTKLILRKNNVLLLDEPTNHLDIASREALESALLSFEGTVIAVSHDRYFMSKLATRIIDLGAEPFYDFRGTYADYLAGGRGAAPADKTAEKRQEGEGLQRYLDTKKQQSEKRRAETRLKKLTEEISSYERRLDEIHAQTEQYATDYKKLTELDEEKNDLEERLLSLYGEQEELSELGNT